MEIKRDKYLNELIKRENNGLIIVITGLRRCGKSYLINTIFKNYLLSKNISQDQIISFALDNMEDLMILDKYLPNEKTLFYDSKNNYTVNSKKFILYIKDIVTSDKNIFYCSMKFSC